MLWHANLGGEFPHEVGLVHVLRAREHEDILAVICEDPGGRGLADAGGARHPHHGGFLLGEGQEGHYIQESLGLADLPAGGLGNLRLELEPHILRYVFPLAIEHLGHRAGGDPFQGIHRLVLALETLDVVPQGLNNLCFLVS